jgi:Permuted papain-like amidase enzyme, YaeF/YiiX, C92 family
MFVHAMVIVSRLRTTLRRRVISWMTRVLTKPLHSYEQRVPNSLANLKQYLRKGDVLLVEGDQRISQVIRYLTQSSWSHAALYIGDELRRYHPELAEKLTVEYGEEARYMVIEAIAGEGVICSPIVKYLPYNLRVCRPRSLRREDTDRVIAEVVAQLGLPYNVRHIIELARYFFPVSLIPHRFRRAALHFGSNATREVICSTMLARAFAHVGYPVLPHVTVNAIAERTHWLRRLLGRNGHETRALFFPEDPSLITPRDFDLSPYFDIIKFNYLAGDNFDYRRIEWQREAEVADFPLA